MISPDLNFAIEAAEPLRFAASPHIQFKLRVTNNSNTPIHSVILRCQIQLDASQRVYTSKEQDRLIDLFGEAGRWGQTLRSVLWTNISVVLPAFDTGLEADLSVPCTFDFNVAATKYLHAVEDDVPVFFFFNGTIFYEGEHGMLQVALISWAKEAAFRMPVSVWREMMDAYYPNTAWLCLQREAFDRLNEYKVKHGFTTFEQALLRALDASVEATA